MEILAMPKIKYIGHQKDNPDLVSYRKMNNLDPKTSIRVLL